MLQIMQELERIEEQAEKIAQKAEQEQDRLPVLIEDFKTNTQKQMNDYKRKVLNQLNADATYMTEKKAQEIQKEKTTALNKLDEEYESNKQAWVQEIIQQVIGGDANVS